LQVRAKVWGLTRGNKDRWQERAEESGGRGTLNWSDANRIMDSRSKRGRKVIGDCNASNQKRRVGDGDKQPAGEGSNKGKIKRGRDVMRGREGEGGGNWSQTNGRGQSSQGLTKEGKKDHALILRKKGGILTFGEEALRAAGVKKLPKASRSNARPREKQKGRRLD